MSGEWVSEVAAVPIPVFRYSVLTSKYVEILERDAFEGMEPCDHCVVVAFEKPFHEQQRQEIHLFGGRVLKIGRKT